MENKLGVFPLGFYQTNRRFFGPKTLFSASFCVFLKWKMGMSAIFSFFGGDPSLRRGIFLSWLDLTIHKNDGNPALS